MGGAYSSGPAKGVYRGIVQEAAIADTQSGGKKLSLTIFGKNDPDHPDKEGKKLFTFSQTFPSANQPAETQSLVKGIWKRLIYDGFGLKWSTEAKPFDQRQLVGKEAFFLVDEKKQADKSMRNDVVAIALEKDKLPQKTNRSTGTVTEAPKGGRARR